MGGVGGSMCSLAPRWTCQLVCTRLARVLVRDSGCIEPRGSSGSAPTLPSCLACQANLELERRRRFRMRSHTHPPLPLAPYCCNRRLPSTAARSCCTSCTRPSTDSTRPQAPRSTPMMTRRQSRQTPLSLCRRQIRATAGTRSCALTRCRRRRAAPLPQKPARWRAPSPPLRRCATLQARYRSRSSFRRRPSNGETRASTRPLRSRFASTVRRSSLAAASA